jgi:hypothetical protein
MRKIVVILLMLGFIHTKAQDLGNIIIAAGNDANKLTQNYLEPAFKGFVYSMNSGWATTAKTHDLFGFDFTIGGNLSFVPSDQQDFLFNANDYEFISLPSGGNALFPTVMSQDSQQNDLNVRVPDGNGSFKVASFKMPGGAAEEFPASAVPAPMLQLGFGLPTRTDIKLRIVPEIGYKDSVKGGMFGLGFQHDLTQYFGVMDKLPFNFSALVAYSHMNIEYKIDESIGSSNVQVQNGKGEFSLNTFTVEALGSLDFAFITLFTGIGYGTGSSSIKLIGNYDLQYELEDSAGNSIGSITETVSDPINIEANNGSFKATLGARLNLAIFKIFVDYSFQEYNTLSAGFAISVR